MARYSYLCEKCGHKEEKIVPISKRNTSFQCPECEEKLTRLIGTGNLLNFIGDGFYCNRDDV